MLVARNVYSVEIENVLSTHPAVLECAVIGTPHETWGEKGHNVHWEAPDQVWSFVSSRRVPAMHTQARTAKDPVRSVRETALAFDIKRLDASFLDDPFPVYRALREHDPIHRMQDGSYFLTRYDDCAAVYRDPATWSSDKKVDFRPNLGNTSLYEHHTTSFGVQRSAVSQPSTQAARSCFHATGAEGIAASNRGPR